MTLLRVSRGAGWHWLSERKPPHSLATCTSATRLLLRERSQCFRVPFARVLPLQRALAPLAVELLSDGSAFLRSLSQCHPHPIGTRSAARDAPKVTRTGHYDVIACQSRRTGSAVVCR